MKHTLPLNIRSIRQARGLTLQELAEIISVSPPHLSEVERGKKNLNNHLLTRISEALEVLPEDLISSAKCDAGKDLYRSIQRLSDEDKEQVKSFVDALRLVAISKQR